MQRRPEPALRGRHPDARRRRAGGRRAPAAGARTRALCRRGDPVRQGQRVLPRRRRAPAAPRLRVRVRRRAGAGQVRGPVDGVRERSRGLPRRDRVGRHPGLEHGQGRDDRAELHGLGAVGRGPATPATPHLPHLHLRRGALAAGDPVHQRRLPAVLRLVDVRDPPPDRRARRHRLGAGAGHLPYGDLGEFINPTGRSWELFSEHDRLDEPGRPCASTTATRRSTCRACT